MELHNWQSYRGKGNVFDFNGPKSTNNSAMIVGRNAQGKSAFFEAVQFVLYGQEAVIDRDSTTDPKRCKPITSDTVEGSPLMNWQAWVEGDLEFSVIADVTIGSDDYTISRRWIAKKKKASDEGFAEEFYIYSKKSKKKVSNPEAFVHQILPPKITKFFMIDGELLIEYRNMFAADRPGVGRDIERILRMDVIDKTGSLLNRLARESKSRSKKILQKSLKSEKQKDELNSLIEDITETEEKIKKCEGKISDAESDRDAAWTWLQKHGNNEARVKEINRIRREIQEYDTELSKLNGKKSQFLANGWKQIMQPTINSAIEGQQSILERQARNHTEIRNLSSRLDSLRESLDNKPCPYCKQTQHKSPEKIAEAVDEISRIEGKLDSLTKQSGTPDPLPIHQRIRNLNKLLDKSEFTTINDINSRITVIRIAMIALKSDEKSVLKQMGSAALEEGIEKRKMHEVYVAEIKSQTEMRDIHIRALEGLNARYNAAASRSKVVITGDAAREERAAKIATTLKQLAEASKEPFRNQTRISLETVANSLYCSLINPNEGHKELTIDEEFRLRVRYEDGTYTQLSPGQRALATYCVLESLSIVSQIEFPLLVDSPGQGVDKEYMGAIFARLLTDSKRQVIVSPTTAEVDLDTAADEYGSELSAIFVLSKPQSTKSTSINEIHRRPAL